MWTKIKQAKYLLLGQYFFLGIILAVFVYQFVTQSLLNQRVDFGVLIESETMLQLFACLLGGVSGGIGYIIISLNDKTRVTREVKNWAIMKNSKISLIILKAMFACSIGGFAFMLITNAMDMESYTNVMTSLFSSENIISYISFVLAACVFAIPLSFGAMKRLRLLYAN